MRKNRHTPDSFEILVLKDLAAGYTPEEIAHRHRFQVHYVYHLMESARTTFGASSTLVAVLMAYRMGYIEIPPLDHYLQQGALPTVSPSPTPSPIAPPDPADEIRLVRSLPAVLLTLLALLSDPDFVAKTNLARGTVLGVKESTVKKRLTRLYRHLGVQSGAAATMRAMELRLLVESEQERRRPKGAPT